jgi:hypothetical protein
MRQPEILDSIKCHTFPGLGGKALDILVHDSTLQNKIVPSKGFKIEMPAHTNQLDACPKAVLGQHCWLQQAGWRRVAGAG